MFRGKNFYNFGYGNLRDYPLADCKFAIEQLADRYAYIDRDRVGIYGHSGGGMMAAASNPDLSRLFQGGCGGLPVTMTIIFIPNGGERCIME